MHSNIDGEVGYSKCGCVPHMRVNVRPGADRVVRSLNQKLVVLSRSEARAAKAQNTLSEQRGLYVTRPSLCIHLLSLSCGSKIRPSQSSLLICLPAIPEKMIHSHGFDGYQLACSLNAPGRPSTFREARLKSAPPHL
jgi:hypothetical protein